MPLSQGFSVAAQNQLPSVSIGSIDGTIIADQNATLTATSSDPDGDELSYNWIVKSHNAETDPTYSFGNSASEDTTFTTDAEGVYTLELTVNDGKGGEASDQISVTFVAANIAPTAGIQLYVGGDALDGSVVEGTIVNVDGATSVAPEDDQSIANYSWTIQGADSSPGNVSSFNINTADLGGSTITVKLIVTDSEGAVSPQVSTGFTIAAQNQLPSVSIDSIDGTITVDQNATLTATSSDPDGDELSYDWIVKSHNAETDPTYSFGNTASEDTTFTTDVDGIYILELTVNDGKGGEAADQTSVTFIAANIAPTAGIQLYVDGVALDGAVVEGTIVNVDGATSVAPEDNQSITNYSWTVQGVDSSPGNVSSFNINTADLGGTSVTVKLIVTDSEGAVSPQVSTGFTIAAANQKPVAALYASSGEAHSSPISTSLSTDIIFLNGEGSSDPDNDSIVTYSFSVLVDGSYNTLLESGSNVVSIGTPSGGEHTYRLIVNDGSLDSDPVYTTLTVNNRPVAAATGDSSGTVGQSVSLDGSGSSDADSGDTLTYKWSFSSKPGGTALDHTDIPNNVTTSFTPDVDGDYTVKLVVNDGKEDSLQDTVDITVAAENQQPLIAVTLNDGNVYEVGENIVVHAEASDTDGMLASYSWYLPDDVDGYPVGSSPQLSDSSGTFSGDTQVETFQTTFTTDQAGTYKVRGMVWDDGDPVLSKNQSVVFTMVAAENQQPVLAVTLDDGNTYETGENIVVHAEASDTDGTLVSYNWYLPSDVEGYPVGSNPQLTDSGGSFSGSNSAETFQTTFTTDTAGIYQVRGRVEDDGGLVKNNSVVFEVSEAVIDLYPSAIVTNKYADATTLQQGGIDDPEAWVPNSFAAFGNTYELDINSDGSQPDIPNLGINFGYDGTPGWTPNPGEFYSEINIWNLIEGYGPASDTYVFLYAGKSTDAEDTSGASDDSDFDSDLTYEWTIIDAPVSSGYHHNSIFNIPNPPAPASPDFGGPKIWYNGASFAGAPPVLKLRPDVPGSYKVMLRVTDSAGNKSTFTVWFVASLPEQPAYIINPPGE